VDIRAATGTVPIVFIPIGAGRPFLTTGSKVTLKLSGLDIRVRYVTSPGNAPAVPPPLIEAGGPVSIHRCAFQVVDGPTPEGSLALAVDSKELTVEGCWFEGFDKAIAVQSYPGMVTQIRETMIVPARPAAGAPPGNDHRGWGIEVHLAPSGHSKDAPRRLVLDHCTFEGAGFLELDRGKLKSSLDVEVKHCAVRAEALLAWNPENPGDRLAAQFPWHGEGNRYAILGKSWIVRSSRVNTPALTAGVTDLESWSRLAVAERDPIRTELRYRTNPDLRADPLRPEDFAFDAPNPPGADPAQVGPLGW
jgi:hypothetical protein